MNVWITQQANGPCNRLMYADKLCSEIGLWLPIIVQTRREQYYLEALCLVMGKNHHNNILVDGLDEPTLDTPPTWVTIPHLD